MRDDPTAATDYLLRVATEEIDYLEENDLLRTFPHVAAVLRHPLGKRVLQQVQNLCWTVERRWRRLRGRRGAAAPVPAIWEAPPIAGHDKPAAPIWIDVTNASRTGYGGGIDRVAMQLAQAGIETGLALPVVIENNGVRPLVRRGGTPEPLSFGPDITYVIVDAFWHQIDEYAAVCAAARDRGAKVVICFHDVIPLDYPSLSRGGFNTKFADSFARIVAASDACIAVSDYTADRVRSLIDAANLRDADRPLPITSFRLGADGHAGGRDGVVRDRIRDIFGSDPVFLGVGTLEPRKGYAIALDAFDRIWQRGIPCRFVIIGRYGWIAKALEQRILTHPLYGTALHWVADASDAEVAFAYRHAYCLVQASVIEGFGLPVVEANREGTPVIATDNAIFRELAGDAITYFRSCDAADLAAAVERAIRQRPSADRLELLSWTDSLAQMVSRIQDMLGMQDKTPLPDAAVRRETSPDSSVARDAVPFGLRRKKAYVTRSAPLGRQLSEGEFPCRNGTVPASIS